MGENVRRGEKMVEGILMSLGHRVTRQRIRDCICSLDPDGNDIRKIRRLKRSEYEAPGSHFLWHLDGCHKLIKFGFVIHAMLHASTEGRYGSGSAAKKERTDKGGENFNVLCFMYEIFG